MLSRRRFLVAGTAVAFAPQLAVPSASAMPNRRPRSSIEQAQVTAAVVADARPGVGGATRFAPLGGATTLARRFESEGLMTFEVTTGAGSLGWEQALAACRSRLGEDRPLGLVCWGEPGVLPAMETWGGTVKAIALLDQVDVLTPVQAARPDLHLLCHLASRRSPAQRREIARKLGTVEHAGGPLIYHWYDVDPGFAVPGRVSRAGDLAWRRTVAFLKRNLDQSATGRAATIG